MPPIIFSLSRATPCSCRLATCNCARSPKGRGRRPRRLFAFAAEDSGPDTLLHTLHHQVIGMIDDPAQFSLWNSTIDRDGVPMLFVDMITRTHLLVAIA